MSNKVEVLFASDDDIQLWMKLVDEVKDSFPGLEIDDYLNILKKNVQRKTALCVKQNNTVIGVLLFSPNQCCISCMAVHPDYRGQGIASALIERMLTLMPGDRDISVTTFRADDEKGLAPRALYKKLGFEETELLYEFDYPVQRFVLQRSKIKD